MRKKHVKVFGERNTGTHFLNALLECNTDLEVLEHGANKRPIERTTAIMRRHSLAGNSEEARYVLERMIDAERMVEYSSTFGWKHAAVSLSQLQSSPLFEDTQFIFLVRNPWRFISSLHHNPYHLIPRPPSDFLSFLSTPFVATERDGFDDCFVASPVDFWNRKVGSYVEVMDQQCSCLLVRYEDLVLQPAEILTSLAGVCRVAARLTIPEHTSPTWKQGQRSYAEYREEVIGYDPRRQLGLAAYREIQSRLDPALLQRMGYGNEPARSQLPNL